MMLFWNGRPYSLVLLAIIGLFFDTNLINELGRILELNLEVFLTLEEKDKFSRKIRHCSIMLCRHTSSRTSTATRSQQSRAFSWNILHKRANPPLGIDHSSELSQSEPCFDTKKLVLNNDMIHQIFKEFPHAKINIMAWTPMEVGSKLHAPLCFLFNHQTFAITKWHISLDKVMRQLQQSNEVSYPSKDDTEAFSFTLLSIVSTFDLIMKTMSTLDVLAGCVPIVKMLSAFASICPCTGSSMTGSTAGVGV